MQLDRLEERQLLSMITVNSTADDATADATLSLREAIEVSDGTLAVSSLSAQEKAQVSGMVGASNTIDFNIPTTDPGYDTTTKVWTIKLKSALPAIGTNAANIDGYSQPGASRNTLAQGDNAKVKIAINGAGAGSISGLTIGQPGSQVRGLDLENCAYSGLTITAAGNVQVAGCFIGTDPTGEAAAPNNKGLVIENSSNLIGGPNVGDRNIVSGNSDAGLYVPDQAVNPMHVEPMGNRVENNYIGLDAAGTKALGNFNAGVYDYGSGNTYGGTTSGLGNVISANKTGGIQAGGNVTIEGNFIGTDATGNVALGNHGGFGGIGSVQDLGGAPVLSVIITYNLVSGNDYGIYVTGSSQKNQATYTIANNLVGTSAAGNAPLGNALEGLFLGSVANASILNNVISANGAVGLRLSNSVAVVQGNLIGTDKAGQTAIGNTSGGILLSSSSGNLIGGTGPGQGNVIADNHGIGIEVDGGQQNRITQNSMFGNTGVGISVNTTVGQPVPAPALTFTPTGGSTGTLSGTLKAAPNLAYTVEIFSDPSALPAGQEQGKTFIKDVTVNTDGSGKGSFSVTEPIGYYAATATDPSGNTSPFSTVVGSQSLAASQTAISSSANPSTAGQPVTFTAVVTASGYQGTPTGTVTFTIDGQARAPVTLTVVGGVDRAQLTTSTLAAGSHTVSATYSGDAKVAASSGSLPSQTVNPANAKPTTTTLLSSSNPTTAGQPVTFTATVSPGTSAGTPTGTVTFIIDGTTEPSVPLQVVAGKDQATFSLSTLTAGTHTIGAAYSGDATFAASAVASPLTQTVNALPPPNDPVATSTTLASSASPSAEGATVTFTATVASTNGTGTPTGTVTFTIDGMAEPPVPLRMAGGRDQAAFSVATLAPGAHTIVARYNGDATFASSTASHPLIQTVSPSSRPVTTLIAPPPVVESLKRYGTRARRTRLVLTFSAALDSARADNPGNYRITRSNGRPIRIRSVVYDPAAETVTLTPRTKISLRRTYHVTVIGTGPGGVADSRDALLDGAGDGQVGSNFVTTLTRSNLVLAPAAGSKPASGVR